MSRKKFDELLTEELIIQRHSLAMQGGPTSCLTLFDNYLLCYSLASQFTSLYRTGKPRDCTPKLDDFKFCFSIKNLGPQQREDEWVRRRATEWATRRMARCSEDVWVAKKYPTLPVERDWALIYDRNVYDEIIPEQHE